MKNIFKFAVLLVLLLPMAPMAQAADRQMTGAQMVNLFSYTRIIKLGGPSSDYYGMLYLRANGTGRGLAFLADGSTKTITGTWAVSNNFFCRTWAEFDGGARVCERWVFLTDSSVKVFKGTTQIGVNSW
jgi:hypothetical protein